MASHLQFLTDNGVLVAIDGDLPDGQDEGGVEKAGRLRDRAGRAVEVTQETFEDAVKSLLSYNAGLLARAMGAMPERPAEAELSFGLKFSGELGAFMITKLTGEATYGVRLLWRDSGNTP
jgi:hypothetical protein